MVKKSLRRKTAKRIKMSQQDRLDIAAARRGMRDLRKHGGYVTYDARQIVNW